MVEIGQIYYDPYYYTEKGQPKGKYYLILALTSEGDIIHRLLTSRAHGRPISPRCSYELPYPSFYLGILGDPLNKESWLDLRPPLKADIDDLDFKQNFNKIKFICTLPKEILCEALICVANAEDTTREQERFIYEQRAKLDCM
jgi:hypothetical protein